MGDPAQYLFDLPSWDGMETIDARDFWKDAQGAVSDVAPWGEKGSNGNIPEPATFALMGLGLADTGYQRRRKFSSS